MKKCPICSKKIMDKIKVTQADGKEAEASVCRNCGIRWYSVVEDVPQDLISQTLAAKILDQRIGDVQQRIKRGTLRGYKVDTSPHIVVSRAAVEKIVAAREATAIIKQAVENCG
jgi:ribosome-binding protein aMBF1 (putative translation factor)